MTSIIAAEPDETGLGEESGATTVTSEETSEESGGIEAAAYRKLQGENDRLRSQSERLQSDFDAYKQGVAPKEQFYDAFKSRPEWQEVTQKAIEDYERGETGTVQEGFNPEQDFVPEEAYQPGTPSYKYRESQEDQRIQKAVNTAVGGIREEMLIGQTLKSLAASGMSEEDASGYMDFLRDPEKYPGGKELLMGPMAKAYSQFKAGNTEEKGAVADAIQTQESFPSAGAFSGGKVAPRSETDRVMDQIIASGQKRSILKNPM